MWNGSIYSYLIYTVDIISCIPDIYIYIYTYAFPPLAAPTQIHGAVGFAAWRGAMPTQLRGPVKAIDQLQFLQFSLQFTMWVCLKMVSTPKPHGFADHYPYWMAISLGIYPIFRQTHVYLELLATVLSVELPAFISQKKLVPWAVHQCFKTQRYQAKRHILVICCIAMEAMAHG